MNFTYFLNIYGITYQSSIFYGIIDHKFEQQKEN